MMPHEQNFEGKLSAGLYQIIKGITYGAEIESDTWVAKSAMKLILCMLVYLAIWCLVFLKAFILISDLIIQYQPLGWLSYSHKPVFRLKTTVMKLVNKFS
jgi:hypothetical protein